MYFFDKRLQYPVRVETPDPLFARQLQQAIGGVEGELRVCLQYFFQAWGARGPTSKYRDMLLNTATEEIGHIEMLATAVAMNLENAPLSLQESTAEANPVVNAVMGGERPRHMVEGMLHKHLLSTGLAAFPGNADGVPFDCSNIYASGNLAADMYSNVTAEATGRTLAVRLYNAAHDPGMKDMLAFLIARDTMHQQQWLAVVEELGGPEALPIPNSFDQSLEKQEFSYVFAGTERNGEPPPAGRFTSGPSLDGKGQFSAKQAQPLGEEPMLGPAREGSGAQREQMGPGKGA
ncbi:manganese catalase family protein [Azospirillum rugosum]|uniref:Mn-containing catalase n=1 Tax=Azospirillum rugosum TaxID=416170 RepID=A0ABS4SRY3_9PROT|nr:manganese catalase family protein [Azospirillum rugosum]MBP2295321.1 Mn-containing catalase [Azospirillum rugosum]MDQ0528696.1 Mn-containing catalase [Azospirillum rugosum]